MSNSTTLLDTINVASSNKESLANALFDASSPAMLWGRHASACNLLVWGYYGGSFTIGTTVNAVANGTVTLTASATNYLQASPTTGAVSANTTGFTSGQIPLYSIVTNATTVTSYTDCRSYAPSATAGSGGGSGTVTDIAVTGGVETNQTSGADITTTGTIRGTMKPIPLAASYTPVTTDRGCVYCMTNATATTLTLPTPTSGATSNFPVGWYAELQNLGVGTCTIAVPSGLKLDGVTNGTLAVPTSNGIAFFNDGTNWFTLRGIAGSGGGGGATTLTALTDVSTVDAAFNDSNVLGYFSNQGKWVARPILLGAIPNATYDSTRSGSQITLSNGNLTATANTVTAQWTNVRALSPHTIGKRYAEFTIVQAGTGSSDGVEVGIVNGSATQGNNHLIGEDTNGVAAFSRPAGTASGLFYNGAIFTGSSGNFPMATGIVVGVAVDFANKKVWFYSPTSGQWNYDVLANQNPATNTGGFDLTTILAANGSLYLATSLTEGTTAPSVTINPGSSAFSNAAPTGFVAWSANASALVQDVAVTSPNDGDHLVYNGASGKWMNVPDSDGEGFVDGNFDQWNVNTTFAVGTVFSYTADMWMAYAGGGGAATVSQKVRTLGSEPAYLTRPSKYQLQFTQTTAASSVSPQLSQRLEGVGQYNGQSITVEFSLAALAAATLVVGVVYTQNFGTGGSPSTSVQATKNVTWAIGTTEQKFSVRLDIPSISGKTLGTAGNDFLEIGLKLATGATFTLYVSQAQIDVSLPTSSSDTTGLGGQPQRFRYAGLAAEKVRVSRYVRAYGYASGQNIATASVFGSTIYAVLPIDPPMRATPSCSLVAGTYTALVNGLTISSYSSSAVVALNSFVIQRNVTMATSAGTAANQAGFLGITAGGLELFDARL